MLEQKNRVEVVDAKDRDDQRNEPFGIKILEDKSSKVRMSKTIPNEMSGNTDNECKYNSN